MQKKSKYPLPSHNKNITLLLVSGLILNLILYHHYGIIKTYDSFQFIANADALLMGEAMNPRYTWYSSYIGISALLKGVGLGFESVIALQVIVFLISAVGLYKLIFQRTSNYKISLVFSFLYLLFFETAQRNMYILTESLFTSLIIGVLYIISIMKRKEILSWKGLILFILVLLAGFVRPNGLLLIGAIILSLMFFIDKPVIKFAVGLVILIVGIIVLDKLIVSLDILNEYERGVVVYNADKVDPQVYDVSGLIMDTNGLRTVESNGVIGLTHFIMKNPIYFLEGFINKIFYMLTHIRPYYSRWHNAWLLFFLIPVYALATYGFIKTQSSFLTLCSLIFVLLNIATVGGTWCVWEGRFLFPILPVLFIYAGFGLSKIDFRKWQPLHESTNPQIHSF